MLASHHVMLDLLQWPALAGSAAAVCLVAADLPSRRLLGFLLLFASSALWAVWGWHAGAWALVALQPVLLAASARGIAAHRAREAPLSDLERDALDAIRSRRPDADFAALVRAGAATDRRRGDRRRAA